MSESYQYSWTCKSCGHVNDVQRTKYAAAFEHSLERTPCTECGGTEYASASFALPEIDTELLEVWFADPSLFFLDQDEDLIIADTDIGVLKNFLKKNDTNGERARSMGPILAVKLYDNNFDNLQQRQWCVQWLAENRQMWVDSTANYITKKIIPILKKDHKNGKTRNHN